MLVKTVLTVFKDKLGFDEATHDLLKKQMLDLARLLDSLSDGIEGLRFFVDKHTVDEYKNRISTIVRNLERTVQTFPRLSSEQIQNEIEVFKSNNYTTIREIQQVYVSAQFTSGARVARITKTVDEKIHEAKTLQGSIQNTLEEFTRTSTGKLASYFESKANSLTPTQTTGKRWFWSKISGTSFTRNSPEYWQERRALWLWCVSVLAVSAIVLNIMKAIVWTQMSEESYLTLLATKAVIAGVLLLQIRFATKNYHIYSHLRESYEYKAIVGNTLIAFLAAEHDPIVKKEILENASKVLFSPIESGHMKHKNDDGVIDQVINQFSQPKS